jgi:hypothetical protein
MESPIKSPRIEADYRRPTEEGFEQVLRELKAGLRQSNQSWRTKKRVLVKT